MVGVWERQRAEKPRDDVWRVWFDDEMGAEKSFQGRKPTRWAYGRGRERKNPEMMCGECGLMTKWAQREAFRGENPRGGCIGKIGAGKAQVWLVYME